MVRDTEKEEEEDSVVTVVVEVHCLLAWLLHQLTRLLSLVPKRSRSRQLQAVDWLAVTEALLRWTYDGASSCLHTANVSVYVIHVTVHPCTGVNVVLDIMYTACCCALDNCASCRNRKTRFAGLHVLLLLNLTSVLRFAGLHVLLLLNLTSVLAMRLTSVGACFF